MSEYWRQVGSEATQLWPDESMTETAKTNGQWEPLECWPEGTVARLREVLEQIAASGPVFDAKGTWSERVCKQARAALAETEASL